MNMSDEDLRWLKFCGKSGAADGWYIKRETSIDVDFKTCKADAAAGNEEAKAKLIRFATWRLKQ